MDHRIATFNIGAALVRARRDAGHYPLGSQEKVRRTRELGQTRSDFLSNDEPASVPEYAVLRLRELSGRLRFLQFGISSKHAVNAKSFPTAFEHVIQNLHRKGPAMDGLQMAAPSVGKVPL